METPEKRNRANREQIEALRKLFIENGKGDEVKMLNPVDLTFRWKVLNIEGFQPKRKEQYLKDYPFLVGFDLDSVSSSQGSAGNPKLRKAERIANIMSRLEAAGAKKIDVSDKNKTTAYSFEHDGDKYTISRTGNVYQGDKSLTKESEMSIESALEYLTQYLEN